jgi:hypothetical protein
VLPISSQQKEAVAGVNSRLLLFVAHETNPRTPLSHHPPPATTNLVY